jgi:hypothetical protein
MMGHYDIDDDWEREKDMKKAAAYIRYKFSKMDDLTLGKILYGVRNLHADKYKLVGTYSDLKKTINIIDELYDFIERQQYRET